MRPIRQDEFEAWTQAFMRRFLAAFAVTILGGGATAIALAWQIGSAWTSISRDVQATTNAVNSQAVRMDKQDNRMDKFDSFKNDQLTLNVTRAQVDVSQDQRIDSLERERERRRN